MITHYTIRYVPSSFSCHENATRDAYWEQSYLYDLTDEEAILAIHSDDYTSDVEPLDPISHDLHELSQEGVHLFRSDDSACGCTKHLDTFSQGVYNGGRR